VKRASRDLIKTPLVVLLTICLGAVTVLGQEIQTAESFFSGVSAKFGEIEDYTCEFTISQGDTVSGGKLYYKRPDLLRLDFEHPEGQVVLSDGEKLMVYLPVAGVILQQSFSEDSGVSPARPPGAMNPGGLYLLSEGYDIAYLDSPEPVPLNSPENDEEEESEEAATALDDEMVVKLRLTRSNSLEMFREIILSISEDSLIRRFRGIADDYSEIVTDFENVEIDQGIPDNRFEEEAWPEANVYPDFLIRTE